MAKRRKLETPSAEDLGKIEDAFRRETPPKAARAPIAQIAAEVAGQYQTGSGEMRRDEAQAAAFRAAEGQGRLIQQVDLEEIEADALQRDRTVIEDEALEELEHSIQAHGLRLPVEVYALNEPKGRKRYGLLSGYRRLIAQRNVHARTADSQFAVINTILRNPDEMGGAFVAMVEENEIRQDLSHYERGRIAVIATQQAAFNSTEDAVAGMFGAASKAKRSKIRSFALIFEELGDVLRFPEGLREKDGLRLAQALRNGGEGVLRDALSQADVSDGRQEWALIEKVLSNQAEGPGDPRRGGRPKAKSAGTVTAADKLLTASGVTLQKERDGAGYLIRFRGEVLTEDMMQRALKAIANCIDSP